MTSIIHEPAPNPSTSPQIKTCQRGQSGPRVQSGSLAHVPKKSSRVFLFFSDFSMLFPFESHSRVDFAHVSNTWQQYNQTKSTFALYTHLRYSAFSVFREFAGPVPCKTPCIPRYCTVQYVCSTKKRIPLETRQSLRFVSFLVYINDELMTCLDIIPE